MGSLTGEQVTIAARFNGPPGSANGGYACGCVAEAIGAGASVRLAAPPPLAVALTRRREDDGSVRLLRDGDEIAVGRPAVPAVEVPAPPVAAVVQRAPERFRGREPGLHPFPSCFVCGPRRDAADGLGLFPGPAGDDGLLACPWTPGADLARDGWVDPCFVWAALDCPTGWACMPPGRPSVLASMTAALEAPVHAGRTYAVTAWPLGGEGRKHRAGAALHDEDGHRVARAEALWITLR